MLLKALLKSVNSKAIINNYNDKDYLSREITQIACHSNSVVKDAIFVCIRGYQTDGHQFAKDAVARGASVLIVEEYLDGLPVIQIKVDNSREALAVIASNFYRKPSEELVVFGVTGTNGKTTITYMTDELFREHGLKTGLIGTVMVRSVDRMEDSKLTTPESVDLQKYLSKMKEDGVTHVSMEVSSSALDLKRVSQTHFDIVAFTNINHDHIDLHGSFQSYFDSKASLIKEATTGSIALLNGDEPLIVPLENQTEAQVVTFGIKNTKGAVHLSDIDLSSGKPTFKVNIMRTIQTLSGKTIMPTSFDISLSIPGYHSIYNATTAILTGLLSDLPINLVIKTIGAFKGVERRFNILYDKEFTVIDDLLLNENNVDSCMQTIQHLDFNALHVVHAIRGNNGPDLCRENAEALVRWFQTFEIGQITLTTSRSHVKEKDRVMKEELETFLEVMKMGHIKVALFEELKEALSSGIERLNHGDLLLISGARGMDYGAKLCLEIAKEKYPYIDDEIIQKGLQDKIVGMTAFKNGQK